MNLWWYFFAHELEQVKRYDVSPRSRSRSHSPSRSRSLKRNRRYTLSLSPSSFSVSMAHILWLFYILWVSFLSAANHWNDLYQDQLQNLDLHLLSGDQGPDQHLPVRWALGLNNDKILHMHMHNIYNILRQMYTVLVQLRVCWTI